MRRKADEEKKKKKLQDEGERLDRIEEAKKHPIPVRVKAIATPTKLNEPKKRSPTAQNIADKRALLNDKERSAMKEKDKLRKREERMRNKEYGSTEVERIAGAARTAKCRSRMSEEGLKEANEKAKLGMRKLNKRKKDDPVAWGEETFTPRKQRKHPIARKNVSRVLRYIAETGKCEELVYYWNAEKEEWLYMNPSGVHYRKLWTALPGKFKYESYDNFNDYEVVSDLQNTDFKDILIISNK